MTNPTSEQFKNCEQNSFPIINLYRRSSKEIDERNKSDALENHKLPSNHTKKTVSKLFVTDEHHHSFTLKSNILIL